ERPTQPVPGVSPGLSPRPGEPFAHDPGGGDVGHSADPRAAAEDLSRQLTDRIPKQLGTTRPLLRHNSNGPDRRITPQSHNNGDSAGEGPRERWLRWRFLSYRRASMPSTGTTSSTSETD